MRQALFLALAAALLFGVLVLPNHPGTMGLQALGKFPLELPVLLAGMIALGRKPGIPALLALILTLTVVLKLADYGMFVAYNRPFNPILDAFLINAGFGLLRDSIGLVPAILSAGLAMIALILLYAALLHALRLWSRVVANTRARLAASVIALIFGGVTVVDAGHALKYWSLEQSPPGTSWTTRLSFKRAVQMRDTAADLVAFRARAQDDPYADATGLFDALEGRDVVLIYIESYGRSSFDNPLYSDTHLATLRAAEGPLSDAGLVQRSGWLTSPTAGGQSWLAHGTLSSGLWTHDNGRYNAMLTSGRRSLFHLAQASGYRTNAIMPAITLPWPESELMGFDQVFAAKDLPYRGERFNWVTMPDQFTLAAYPALLNDDPRPDFTQIALISSHAPWVPIPPVVGWDEVGDGSIFSQWASAGPTPREVWKDRDTVREQYRIAIDYALEVTLAHVARLGPEAPLVMVVGDHQPAGFVAQIDSKDVPIHMIGPREVIERIEPWSWTPGLIPDPELAAWPMDAFRNRFIETFSTRILLGSGSW